MTTRTHTTQLNSLIFVLAIFDKKGTHTHANTYIGKKLCSCVLVSRSNEMNEKIIEKKLVEEVRSMGGLCPKFVSPGLDGVPDRIVLFPMGKAVFAETKAPGKVMRPVQMRRKQQLESLGFKVYLIDGFEKIGEMIDEIRIF